MKNLASKILFGAAVVMMSAMISCKDKDATNADTDMDTTNVVVDPVTPAPATQTPADTSGMSSDTTMVTP